MFGRSSNIHAPILNAAELNFDANAWLTSQRLLFEAVYPAIKEVLDQKHEKANAKFNQSHRMVNELQPGTAVAVKELVRGSKSNPPFQTGNFSIKGKDPANGAYVVVNNNSNGQTTRHVSQLKIVPSQSATHIPDTEESKEYVITEILDHKGDARQPSKATYLVHWKGYSSADNSWIPYDAFVDKKPITAYWQKLRRPAHEAKLSSEPHHDKRRKITASASTAITSSSADEEKHEHNHVTSLRAEKTSEVSAHATNTPRRTLKRPILHDTSVCSCSEL